MSLFLSGYFLNSVFKGFLCFLAPPLIISIQTVMQGEGTPQGSTHVHAYVTRCFHNADQTHIPHRHAFTLATPCPRLSTVAQPDSHGGSFCRLSWSVSRLDWFQPVPEIGGSNLMKRSSCNWRSVLAGLTSGMYLTFVSRVYCEWQGVKNNQPNPL